LATLGELQLHVGRLATILWNYGASFPEPTLDRYSDTGNVGFRFNAELPGDTLPGPATIRMAEVWDLSGPGEYRRFGYTYDFLEYPMDRRRAFHGHDPEHFAREFSVLVHEHCEEVLGVPACDHYYGLPVDADEAIRRFTSIWGQRASLGCDALRCLGS
jgi:hypothetical protein